MNMLELNKNYLAPKIQMDVLGLNDSTWFDGVYARPYVQEYLPDGSLNPEFTDWRAKPFVQRGYKLLGHGNALQWNLTRE